MQKKIMLTPRTYKKLYETVKNNGQKVAPRSKETTEIVNAALILKNPIDRIVTSRERKINIAFGVAEFYSLVFAIDDLEFFTKFISSYDDFSTDGLILDGAYGTRINSWIPESLRRSILDQNPVLENYEIQSQIQEIVERLFNDPFDRRAVISIYDHLDLFGNGGKNTPCTLSLQFLIRNNKLDMITTMRSNDIYRGLPYDMFSFTMLQELIAKAGGWRIGTYYHNVGSLHYYVEDEHKLSRMSIKRTWPFIMEKMPSSAFNTIPLNFFKVGMTIANEVGKDYHKWFVGNFSPEVMLNETLGDNEAIAYYHNLLCCVSAFVNRIEFPDYALKAYSDITDKTLRYAVYGWLAPHIKSNKFRMRGPVGSHE